MFDHFTFGAVATSYYQPDQQEEREISPSDCSLPSPLSPHPAFQSFPQVAREEQDIISKFAQQSLRPDLENERPQRSFCMMDEQDEFSRDDVSFVSTTRGMTVVNANTPPLPDSRPNGGCRRLKRQHNMQLQSSTSHIKNINALVEDMIVTESQCVLRQSPSRSQLGSPPPSRGRDEPIALVVDTQPLGHRADEPFTIEVDEDEGFAEMEDDIWGVEEEMTLRRACTPSGIRKYNGLKWRRSFEAVGLPSSTGAPPRMKVRSVPRMRRRKPKAAPVPE